MRIRKDNTDLLWKKYENFLGITEKRKKRSGYMDILEKLINLSGPSGNEQPVRAFIKQQIEQYVSDVHVDKFGNLIARKKGKKPTVILVAHMDEIGIMIKSIDDNGWIYCTEVGGIDPVILLGERVTIETKKGEITGVITTKSIAESGYQETIPKMGDLIIDTGLTKKQLLEAGVEIGSYLHLMSQPTYLGNKDLLCGKALDDRAGCYILLELAKRLKNTGHEVYFIFTVQEEVGLYGAKTSIYQIDPDWAIIVDVSNTDEFTDKTPAKAVGKGPCITIKDSDMIGNRCINGWFKDIAKKHKIPLQYDISEFGTTDALSISVSKGGIPTGVLSVPIRNLHTTTGVVSRKDIEHAITLIEVLLKKPPRACLT